MSWKSSENNLDTGYKGFVTRKNLQRKKERTIFVYVRILMKMIVLKIFDVKVAFSSNCTVIRIVLSMNY